MRMNYKTYPTDYIRELKRAGKRKKAMAFMDYWDDMELGDFGSVRFYEKAWKVGKSTVARWIKEFDYEIDLFLNHWELKNKAHYEAVMNKSNLYDEQSKSSKQDRSVKKPVGQLGHSEWDEWDTQEVPKNRDSKDSSRTTKNQEWDKGFNNNTTTTKKTHLTDKTFNELIFLYRVNGGNSQNSVETYEAYKQSIEELKDVGLLKVAMLKYLRDSEEDYKVWFKRFLEEKIYQKYLTPLYKITRTDGMEVIGTYDEDVEKFYTTDKKIIPLDVNTYYKLMADNRVTVWGYVA